MRELGVPQGLAPLGYGKDDIPALVHGTLSQNRITKLAPRLANEQDLYRLFTEALNY